MTLDEIAKALQISKSTVSRALSGKGRVSNATRMQVKEFAEKNGVMSTLNKIKLTGNIGVVFPADFYINGNSYFLECVLGICETASLMDYNVFITTATAGDILSIERLVEQKKVDGMILTRSLEDDKAIRYLLKNDIPTGLTGFSEESRIIRVDTDNEEAAESLTTLLIKSGYERFALVVDDMSFCVNRSRYDGFYNGILKNGLAKEQQRVYTNKLVIDMVDTLIEDMITKKVECVICGDDIICTHLTSRIQALGYRIPKDIAVASLYNSPILQSFLPPVTAVEVSARNMGSTVSKQLIQYMEGKPYKSKVMIDYEILLRKSTLKV